MNSHLLNVSRGQLTELLGLEGAPFLLRMSELFWEQLRLGAIYNFIHPEKVLMEIWHIEGIGKKTPTKPASQFSREPLKGLWHKHFYQSGFLGQNLLNEGKHWNKIIKECSAQATTPEELSWLIAHKISIERFEERSKAGEMTGEWIVFDKHNGENYYLTVGGHNEGDQRIYERVLLCRQQFPFLTFGAVENSLNSSSLPHPLS